MELLDFLTQTQADVKAAVAQALNDNTGGYPYPEYVFAEVVMEHLAEAGMTFEPAICHYEAKVGSSKVKLTGYALSEDGEQLDLFVSLYGEVEVLTPVPDSETKNAADQCLRFLSKCAEGRLTSTMDEAHDAYALALTIQESYAKLDQIRVYVLTDRVAKTKQFKARDVEGKTVKLEVMDIERLYRHVSEGKPRDELMLDFQQVCGGALPCVYVPRAEADYDYALTAIPAEALRLMYEKYGSRLLEANVRSFLSVTGKVNKGIRDTLKTAPGRFMAYNNGIVIVADEVRLGKTEDGGPGLLFLKGMQIVNGGQTTASLYFTKKKDPEIDLSRVRVPAKVIVLHSTDALMEESLIADISRFANSQNAVKVSDLSANKAYHVEVEKLSLTTYLPDGVGRWFYERAAGSYAVMLARDGMTSAKLKQLRTNIPPSRKISKTDLAKFLNAWDQKPDSVSFGSQKNFEAFMADLKSAEDAKTLHLPGVPTYKRIVAKAIIFKSAQRLVRPMFKAFQANVATYLVSLLANRLGEKFDLDLVWANQRLSHELLKQMEVWSREVNQVLHETSGGRMVSEWAKKAECWEAVVAAKYSVPNDGLPEVKEVEC